MSGLKRIAYSILERYHLLGAACNNALELKYYMRRIQLEDKMLNTAESGISNERYAPTNIIVSLTTHGRRLNDVCFTIESIMQQTFKPNKIILAIDSSLVANLPMTLARQIDRGLTILPTKDMRSYTKLIPALKEYPDDAIITIDDDLIYDFDIVERLVKSYRRNPKNIYACRVHSMEFDNKGRLLPYHKWGFTKPSIPKRHFLTGVGGVLYPPNSLGTEVFNEKVFKEICPTADDVWFTAMAKMNFIPIEKVETRNPNGDDNVSNYSVQDMGLCNINTGKNGKNDEQIKAVFTKYGIYDLIR